MSDIWKSHLNICLSKSRHCHILCAAPWYWKNVPSPVFHHFFSILSNEINVIWNLTSYNENNQLWWMRFYSILTSHHERAKLDKCHEHTNHDRKRFKNITHFVANLCSHNIQETNPTLSWIHETIFKHTSVNSYTGFNKMGYDWQMWKLYINILNPYTILQRVN